MKWPWTKKTKKQRPLHETHTTCICAACGEIVGLYDPCWCDRKED